MGSGTGVSPDHRATEGQIEDELLALVTQLTNEINWYMRERGLTRADLAARMGVSPGRVSQILSGGENLTLRTLAALSTALDARFDIELSALKGGEAFTRHGTTQAESAGNHHIRSRTTRRGSAVKPGPFRSSPWAANSRWVGRGIA
jgi:transcriptional regulator with XRE-family HTH domain